MSIPSALESFVGLTRLKQERDLDALEKGEGNWSTYHGTENFLYHNGAPMRYLAYLEFAPGVWRGNHIHHEKEEFICVVKGHLIANLALPSNPEEVYQITLQKGDVLNLKPGVAHALMAPQGGVAVEFSPQNFKQTDHIPFAFVKREVETENQPLNPPTP